MNEAEAMNKSELRKDEVGHASGTHGITGGGKCYRYPIYIDNFNDDNGMPIVQECIHFTAVKQGGISLQKPADESSEKAAREAQVDTVSKGTATRNSLGQVMGGGARQGFAGGFFETIKAVVGGVNKTIETASALVGQKAGEDGLKTPVGTGDPETVSSVEQFVMKKAGGNFIKGQLANMQSKAKNLEHCFLYMPSSLASNDGAQWGAEGLGAVGNMIKVGLRGTGTVDDMLKDAMGGVAADVGKAVAIGAGVLAAGAAGAIGAAAMLGGVGNGLRAAGRFVSNPYEEQLFNGIGFREFSFEFALAPASEAEGEQVTNIIRMFRKNSRPNFIGGNLRQGLYTFPNEFAIKFFKNSGGSYIENEHLPRIHNCVCTNVSTNFAPEGFWVALKDGRPVSYVLSLTFAETKKLTQDDISGGY
jgi:hypothetical protein